MKVIKTLCVIFLLLFLNGCEREYGTQPQQLEIYEGPQCEKDGIIEICFDKVIMEDGQQNIITPLDTLFISESQNKLHIPDAIPFALPSSNYFEFYFTGVFDGMISHAVIWLEYYQEISEYLYDHNRQIFFIENNHGTIMIPDREMVCLDSLRGYIFCLDSDDNHEGLGTVTLQSGDFSIEIDIDASIQTVNYLDNASQIEFSIDSLTTNIKVKNTDQLSYNELKDGAVWFLSVQGSEEIIGIGTSNSIHWLALYSEDENYTAYGFAPKF